MGGSPVAAQEASDDAAAARVVGSHVDSASNPLPPPGSATSAAEGDQEHAKPEAPAEAASAQAPVEAKQEAATAAAAAGVQAMAVTVVRDVEAGPDASTSGQGGDKPSWFTPKR